MKRDSRDSIDEMQHIPAQLLLGRSHAYGAVSTSQHLYYVTAIIHGRTLESGAVLQIVDSESNEVFAAEVLSITSMGVELELDLYRQDHNQHLFLEVPMDGVDVLQR